MWSTQTLQKQCICMHAWSIPIGLLKDGEIVPTFGIRAHYLARSTTLPLDSADAAKIFASRRAVGSMMLIGTWVIRNLFDVWDRVGRWDVFRVGLLGGEKGIGIIAKLLTAVIRQTIGNVLVSSGDVYPTGALLCGSRERVFIRRIFMRKIETMQLIL